LFGFILLVAHASVFPRLLQSTSGEVLSSKKAFGASAYGYQMGDRPSPPGPLSRTAGEGVNVEFCALKDTSAMVCERSPVAADTTVG